MKTIEVVAGVIVKDDMVFATARGYGEFKGWWEFPGGKMEVNETPQQALNRELREELAIDVKVERFIKTVEYDYPNFHLTMHCYFCLLQNNEEPKLLEHENAKWVTTNELNTLNWLPADVEVLDEVVKLLDRNND